MCGAERDWMSYALSPLTTCPLTHREKHAVTTSHHKSTIRQTVADNTKKGVLFGILNKYLLQNATKCDGEHIFIYTKVTFYMLVFDWFVYSH